MRRRAAGAASLEDLIAGAEAHGGVALGVLRHGERRVLTRGGVGADSIFEIGSVTKVFTALLLARMAVDDRVRLDEPAVPGRPITLADLASHTAGLPRLPPGLVRSSLRNARDPYARFDEDDLERALRSSRARRPGRVRYSNFGVGLLGHVLAQRAGLPYAELVAREICTPLDLRDTTVSVPEHARGRLVTGHDRRGRPVPPWTFRALVAAGGLHSTADDLLAFLAFHLDPPPTPLGEAARLSQRPRPARGRARAALGWMRRPFAGGELLWHNGGTGGFRSFAGFAAQRGTAVVALSDRSRSVDGLALRALALLR